MALQSPVQPESELDLTTSLRELFGFPAFRERQEEIVRRAVEGRDTLALMPTGAGKSLCYQLAAMLRPTPTLVISPLIALMKDQIDNLPDAVAGHASLINSSLDPQEAAERLRRLASGEYRLIYVAPERLRQRAFVSALRSVHVGLVVIDEVHCVSMWGHDFRPDYLFIGPALAALGNPSVLGLTATATPATERDISESLGRDLEPVRTSVVRANLRYEVERVENEEARLRATLARVKALGGSGIIYARARQKCEQLALMLERNGVRAVYYHAGLESDDRSRVQEVFLRGKARVVVATTAFGMGIDKPDIRWVLLYNFPNSLESYVQMVGRAGRDGLPSTCVLLASDADASSLRRFARTDIPSVDDLRSVYRVVRGYAREEMAEVSAEELQDEAGLGEDTDPRVLIGMLQQAGLLRRDYDAGRAFRIELLPPPSDAARRIPELLARYEAQAAERANRMVAFAESRRCRHLQVAEHFGETVTIPCGMCDVCTPDEGRAVAPAVETKPLPEDIAGTIMNVAAGLYRPLGQKGLVALLKGSVSAPPSAQRHPLFGVLSGAKEGTIKRWIVQLTDGGHLVPFESDGYRLLRVGDTDCLPNLSPVPIPTPRRVQDAQWDGDMGGSSVHGAREMTEEEQRLFERLRKWRFEQARDAGVPSYVVMPDKALIGISVARPATHAELLAIHGIGPAKLERYGDDVLEMVREEIVREE